MNMICVCFMSLIDIFEMLFVFFFFKQKTAYEMRISDWSSDVCSSDLLAELTGQGAERGRQPAGASQQHLTRGGIRRCVGHVLHRAVETVQRRDRKSVV